MLNNWETVMNHKGTRINGKNLKELRLKKRLSQEALSEESFHQNCYVSTATLKRAELGCCVSNNTLKKLAAFFDVSSDCLIECEQSIQDEIVINIDKILELRNSNSAQHQELLSIYEKLKKLLSLCADDEQVQAIFEHSIR